MAVGAWALLLIACTLAVAGMLFDTAGFGMGYGVLSISGLATLACLLACCGLLRSVQRWRRALEFTAVIAVAILLVVVFPPRWLLGLLHSPRVPLYVVTTDPIIALTIDDGVDPETTPQILDVLDRHNVQATFFALADTLVQHPKLAERIVAAGHDLGNHQTRDERGWQMPPDEFADDIRRAGSVLAGYGDVRYLRPGGGLTTGSIRDAAENQGYRIALGSVFPLDSHIPSINFAAGYIHRRAFPGAIIVLHEGGERGRRTAEILERALPRLKAAGYRIGTLDSLFASADGP